MIKIEVKSTKGGIDMALKNYKRKVIQSKQLKEFRERKFFKKASAIKREQKIKAIYKQKLLSNLFE